MEGYIFSTVAIIVIGVWLIPTVALPLVEQTPAKPAHSLFIRSVSMAILSALYFKGHLWVGVDKFTPLIALGFSGGAIGLFYGIRSQWGLNRSVIMVIATPVVNVLVGWLLGRPIPFTVVASITVLIGGIVVALGPGIKEEGGKAGNLSYAWGFTLNLIAVLSNAAFYEGMHQTRAPFVLNCFWTGIGLSIASFVALWLTHKSGDLKMLARLPKRSLLMLLIVFTAHGFPYLLSNHVLFNRLPVEPASIIAQAEIPLVLGAIYLTTKKKMTLVRWGGLVVALVASLYVTIWSVS